MSDPGDFSDYGPLLLQPMEYGEPRFIDTIFNFTSITSGFTNLFNDSTLLTYAGVAILAIVLFEIALYALDVYYNQTYLQTSSFSRFDSFDDTNGIYSDYPPYPDPFGSTYRSRKDDFSVGKVLEWISLLHEAWSLSSSTVSSLDCQKRAVCEIWSPENKLYHTDKMDLVFKYAEMLSLPDQLVDLLDEWGEAREQGEDHQKNCHQRYPDCDGTSLTAVLHHYSTMK